MRKGPEHVPDSMLVLLFAIASLLFATFCSAMLIETAEADSVVLSFMTSVMGYALYTMVLATTGFIGRFVPTISSIMACGSLLTVLMVAAYVMLRPFLGAALASIVATLVLFWSVPVKGHIIARAIERHWYVGIVIAVAVFALQYAIYVTMTGRG